MYTCFLFKIVAKHKSLILQRMRDGLKRYAKHCVNT